MAERRIGFGGLLLVGVAGLLAGCSSGGVDPVTVTTTSSASSSAPAPPPSPTSSSVTTSSGPAAAGGAPTLPNQTVGVDVFRAPSGNIVCAILHDTGTPSSAECAIKDASFATKAPATACDLDWQPRYATVSTTGVEVGRCAGDPSAAEVYNTEDGGKKSSVLKYGQTTLVVDLACQSQQSGMTCWNISTGKGFTVSRASLRTF